MEPSNMAKERFCKDCNIPIRLFKEPYFTDRIILYDKFYGTIEKWNIFVEELQKYHCEQDYFEEYNRIKDAAIQDIKNSEAFQRFNEEDMNKYSIPNKYESLPGKDIFKPSNDGRFFLSIDMKKANFSALQYYNKDIFNGAETWEEFIGRYTNNSHIVNSKYIRQVILGNCNPRRQITYEKYLMAEILDYIIMAFLPIENVAFFSNDEIVFDITDNNYEFIEDQTLRMFLNDNAAIPLHIETFTLHKINGTDGYYKEIHGCDREINIDFKCLDNYILPFVLRKFLGEEITDSDKVFYHEGLLAQFIEVP